MLFKTIFKTIILNIFKMFFIFLLFVIIILLIALVVIINCNRGNAVAGVTPLELPLFRD